MNNVIINGQTADFVAALFFMDSEIYRSLRQDDDQQAFMDSYCAAHLAKFGSAFEVAW